MTAKIVESRSDCESLLEYNFRERAEFSTPDVVVVHKYIIEQMLANLKEIEKRSPCIEVKRCLGIVEAMSYEVASPVKRDNIKSSK